MKITKRQLRRIIKEEKQKLLRESVTDMTDFGGMLDETVERIAWGFGDAMFRAYDEDPEMFAGRSTQDQWERQVEAAQNDLVERLTSLATQAVNTVEMQLHDGQYRRG